MKKKISKEAFIAQIAWNFDTAKDEKPPLPKITGTREEQAREIIRRCDDRDASLLEGALAMEAAGDAQGCWFAMASRAENKRFRDKVAAQLEGWESKVS